MSSRYAALARQQAAAWVVRLDAGDLGADEQAQLHAWLAMDPSHAQALARAQQTWGELDRLGANNAGAATPSAGQPALSQRKRPYRAWLSACAALLLAATGLWQVPHLATTWHADAVTDVGETRRIALAGGGSAQMDTHSAIRLADSAQWRDVQVLAGTVSFEVGHDDPRPFRVRVGESVITDIGTTFQVRRSGDTTQVVVASGEVAVASPGGTARIQAGQVATVGRPNHPLTVSPTDTDAAMAWTRGRLVFVDRPLGEVVDELNRYYRGHIVLLGSGAADRRVSGVFRTADPLAALRVIERNLGLRARDVGLGLIVLGG